MQVNSAYNVSHHSLYQSPAVSLFDRRLASDAHRPYQSIHVNTRPDSDHAVKPESHIRASRRLSTCGFLPMPPISASPICTPTISTSSRNLSDDLTCSSGSTDGYVTAPLTPNDTVPPPTWISIPPTPPPKLFRRSVTCVARQPRSPVTPSASFPAFTPSADVPKRRASVPTLSFTKRRNNGSEDSIGASPLRTSHLGSETAPLKAPLPKRKPPMFSISHEVNSDNEDNEASGSTDGSIEAASSDLIYDNWHIDKARDDARKYYALMELLSTEVRYLMDLRVLVTIYLRQLPTITCRTPASAFGRNSSFTSASRSNSHSHLQSVNNSTVNIGDLHGLQPLTSITPEKKDKTSTRYLLTNADIDLITRNAEDVLQLHDHLVEEVRAAMVPLGFSMNLEASSADPVLPSPNAMSNLDAALAYIATKFATESSRFNAYEVFCAGHPEALDIVRKAQHQHGTEWDLYEQRCSALLYDLMGSESGKPSSTSQPSTESSASTPQKETSTSTSVSSLDGAVQPIRPRSVGGSSYTKDSKEPDFSSGTWDNKRLSCVDYLITPMQRICRYPLLLDQLKTSKAVLATSPPQPPGRSDVNVIIQSAAQAMRHVASRVDDARHRHDVALQSSLITSRISRSIPPVASSQATSASQQRQVLQFLTPSFLSSLGVCLLAGSLDVMHNQGSSSSSIHAKYLGAFLYLGGYLVLVKVSKGKTYEPKHWFCLSDFELSDSDTEALVPCSFRLTCKGHQFDLAAACQREKDVWLSSIREARSHTATYWINEPVSSLHIDGKAEPLDEQCDTITSLPISQSFVEKRRHSDYPELTESLREALATDPKASKQKVSDIPSRRSSTASVKGILYPNIPSNPDTVLIRRSSPSARQTVDQGLRDVISEPCLTARTYASSREEDLFQASSITRSGPTRSQSTLSMSRLKKHESVRVPRRQSVLEPYDPTTLTSRKAASRAKSLTFKKRPQKLNLTSTNSEGECVIFISPSENLSSSLTSPTTTISYPPSTTNSPIRAASASPARRPRSRDGQPQRTVSRTNSLAGLFRSHPPSPVKSINTTPKKALPSKPSTSSFKRWMKGPFHRRTHSAPDDAKPPSLVESPKLPDLYFGSDLKLTTSPKP